MVLAMALAFKKASRNFRSSRGWCSQYKWMELQSETSTLKEMKLGNKERREGGPALDDAFQEALLRKGHDAA